MNYVNFGEEDMEVIHKCPACGKSTPCRILACSEWSGAQGAEAEEGVLIQREDATDPDP